MKKSRQETFNYIKFYIFESNRVYFFLRNIFIIICFGLGVLRSQTTPFYVKAQMLNGTFKVYHPKPFELNSEAAAEVVNLFVDELDRSGFILTEYERNAIKRNGSGLFEQIESKNDEYITNAHAIFKRALNSYDSILTIINLKGLLFSDKDSISFLPYTSKPFYSPDIKKHMARIERYIKSVSLDRVLNTVDYDKLNEEQFYAKAREFSKPIIKNIKRNVQELLNNSYQYTESCLLNALAHRYDPHSNFFTDEQKQEFSKHLAVEVESFGFYFNENDKAVAEIGYIEPGGAAWMSNEVHEGDLFISMQLGNVIYTNEDFSADELQKKMESSDEKTMTLTLRKKNGLQKTVKLVKHKAASDENSVKGYILRGNGAVVAYMALPSFYTDMQNQTLPGCANDVAKELLKLEGDSVQGLILDLRNNGGGSMLEAINLAGIFIDEGPLFIYKEKNKKPALIKDINRGSIFKKPLVVLINEASASASELFSNIVQDYNLGIVVGQTSYGKGTAQQVIPLDTMLLINRNFNRLKTDYIKITNGKFYRLNGSTHQGKGVVPHVQLPATPGYSLIKECKEEFYLPPDSIIKKVVYTPHPALGIAQITQASQTRVNSSPDFKKFTLYSDSVNTYIGKMHRIALSRTGYLKNKIHSDRLFMGFEQALKGKNNVISCFNNSFDKKLYEVNQTVKDFNTRVIEAISQDMFINESYLIINDLINQQPK